MCICYLEGNFPVSSPLGKRWTRPATGQYLCPPPKTAKSVKIFARFARFARLALTLLRLVVYRRYCARPVRQVQAGAESGSALARNSEPGTRSTEPLPRGIFARAELELGAPGRSYRCGFTVDFTDSTDGSWRLQGLIRVIRAIRGLLSSRPQRSLPGSIALPWGRNRSAPSASLSGTKLPAQPSQTKSNPVNRDQAESNRIKLMEAGRSNRTRSVWVNPSQAPPVRVRPTQTKSTSVQHSQTNSTNSNQRRKEWLNYANY